VNSRNTSRANRDSFTGMFRGDGTTRWKRNCPAVPDAEPATAYKSVTGIEQLTLLVFGRKGQDIQLDTAVPTKQSLFPAQMPTYQGTNGDRS